MQLLRPQDLLLQLSYLSPNAPGRETDGVGYLMIEDDDEVDKDEEDDGCAEYNKDDDKTTGKNTTRELSTKTHSHSLLSTHLPTASNLR